VEGCRGCSEAESNGTGGVEKEGEGGTGGRSGCRGPVSIFIPPLVFSTDCYIDVCVVRVRPGEAHAEGVHEVHRVEGEV